MMMLRFQMFCESYSNFCGIQILNKRHNNLQLIIIQYNYIIIFINLKHKFIFLKHT